MNKIIQKAKEKHSSKKQFTKDEVEAALAYVKSEINLTGLATALGLSVKSDSHKVYGFVARALRQHYSK
jgi:hypothetical protein